MDPIKSQRFAVMGEYGNNVICYDTESFLIQHHVQVGSIVKSFRFANRNQDLLVVTKDCRVKFYSLLRYEGVFMREVSHCHRGMLTALDVSANSGYMLTGGEDRLLKIWDYEAQKTDCRNFQSFIGHSYGLSAVMFNPKNQSQIISVGARDGIFFWDFNGDIEADYHMPMVAGQDMETLDSHRMPGQVSKLSEMRTTNKAPKEFRNQMREDSFYLPEFVRMPYADKVKHNETLLDVPDKVKEARKDAKVPYNHYLGCSKKPEVEIETSGYFDISADNSR